MPDFVRISDLPKDEKGTKFAVYVYVPVVVSDVIQGNGLTPYINYFAEQLFLAYKLPQLSRVARSPFDTVASIMKWLALIGAAVTSAKVIIKWLKERKKKEEGSKKQESFNLTEQGDFLFDKPRQIEVERVLYRIIAVNFVTRQDVDVVIAKKTTLWKRFVEWLKSKFKRVIGVLSKEVFVCYSTTEVDEEQLKGLIKTPSTNVIVVDMVNDIVTAYCNFEGKATTVNTIKLSDLKRQKQNMRPVENIDKVVRLLKTIKVRPLV